MSAINGIVEAIEAPHNNADHTPEGAAVENGRCFGRGPDQRRGVCNKGWRTPACTISPSEQNGHTIFADSSPGPRSRVSVLGLRPRTDSCQVRRSVREID